VNKEFNPHWDSFIALWHFCKRGCKVERIQLIQKRERYSRFWYLCFQIHV